MASLTRFVAALLLHGALVVADAPAPTMPNTVFNCNKWYVAKAGDTCTTATKAGGINLVKFNQWNPDVPKDCSVNFLPDYAYCIGVDASMTVPPSSTTKPASSSSASKTSSKALTLTTSSSTTVNATYSIRNPITTWNITTTTRDNVFPPVKTQAGQPSYCIDWHYVLRGDTCLSVVNRYKSSLTLDMLLDYNPALLDDCSGLQNNWWLCIRVQSQESLTLEIDPATSISIPTPTSYVSTTMPALDPSFTASPTQGDLPSDCRSYYKAEDNDRCDNVLQASPWLSKDQFFQWNSFLSGNCDGLWSGYYYCTWAGSIDKNPPAPVETSRPANAAQGSASNCNAWYEAFESDTCDIISQIVGTFTTDSFKTWNPSVYDCNVLQAGRSYCVGVPGTPTTRVVAVPTMSWSDQRRTQAGIAADCSSWWLVSPSDKCSTIASKNDISLEQFFTWNPAVMNAARPDPTNTTCANLLPDYHVCVKASGGSSGPKTSVSASVTASATRTSQGTTKAPASTTTSGGAVSTPQPIQAGTISGCRRFYKVRSGDGCWAIANDAKVDLYNEFFKWNSGIDSNCSNLVPDVYVCIGISGPTTTISSGPPVPT